MRRSHVPKRPYSDMLASCGSSNDYREKSFVLHRRNKWSFAEFENLEPDNVTYTEVSGEITISITINRDARRHFLAYEVDPMTTIDN